MVIKQTLQEYVASLTQVDITQSLPDTLLSQLSTFNDLYANASSFPVIEEYEKRSILVQASQHLFMQSNKYDRSVLPIVTFFRLLLRSSDSLTSQYIVKESVLEQLMTLYSQVNGQDFESIVEMIKLLINFGHVESSMRKPLTAFLPRILAPFSLALQTHSEEEILENIFFFTNRLVFYTTFEKSCALETWSKHADLITEFWGLDRELSSRNKAEVLKLIYNLSIHHTGEEDALERLFSDQVLSFIRTTLERNASLRNDIFFSVSLTGSDNDLITVECKELNEPIIDKFSTISVDIPLVAHSCQVLMNILNRNAQNVFVTEDGLNLPIIYGILRIFLAFLDNEDLYNTLQTPIAASLVVACKAVPELRDELYRGIMNEEWTLRSINEALVQALPAEKQNLKQRASNLEGILGGPVKENLKRLLTHYIYNFKSTLAQLLFTICEEDMGEFVSQFGPGNTAGYLADTGMLASIFSNK